MPNCYVLKNKVGESLTGNAQFIAIDEAMCKHFGVDPDADKWYYNWENLFGIGFATGRTYEDIRGYVRAEKGLPDDWTKRVIEILDWMEEHYTIEAWFQNW